MPSHSESGLRHQVNKINRLQVVALLRAEVRAEVRKAGFLTPEIMPVSDLGPWLLDGPRYKISLRSFLPNLLCGHALNLSSLQLRAEFSRSGSDAFRTVASV